MATHYGVLCLSKGVNLGVSRSGQPFRVRWAGQQRTIRALGRGKCMSSVLTQSGYIPLHLPSILRRAPGTTTWQNPQYPIRVVLHRVPGWRKSSPVTNGNLFGLPMPSTRKVRKTSVLYICDVTIPATLRKGLRKPYSADIFALGHRIYYKGREGLTPQKS